MVLQKTPPTRYHRELVEPPIPEVADLERLYWGLGRGGGNKRDFLTLLELYQGYLLPRAAFIENFDKQFIKCYQTVIEKA